MLLRQLIHFFALMLWTAAVLAWIGGLPELAVAIAVIVIVNALFSFAQEYRADRAAASLRSLLPARVRVIRDGVPKIVDAAQLVCDDLVELDAGDRICADMTLVHANALGIDESMLTGESVAVRPHIGATVNAGTFVVEGTGRGTVSATGRHTRLAGIAALTRAARRPRSPLAGQLHHVVTVIAITAVAVGITLFGVGTLLGTPVQQGFLFAVGVTVALVPEGLLPTVTLSLARAAQLMAKRSALVRHLEAVETLGSTTMICTDKTGTLTQNRMSVVTVWTPAGMVDVSGDGYEPVGTIIGSPAAVAAATELAGSAMICANGRPLQTDDGWIAHGDPTDVALAVLGQRCGHAAPRGTGHTAKLRFPFDSRRKRSSVLVDGTLHVLGAPDSVLPRCDDAPGAADRAQTLAKRGLRVLAVARRAAASTSAEADADTAERDLQLLGLVGIEDPPRAEIAASVTACRRAGIKIAILTGDHPATATAVAHQIGLFTAEQRVLIGAQLPADDDELGAAVDHDGVVVARVTPEDKLRVARALQRRGHVVAMTGDGVNDGPALRQADIGVAMGATGTDVAREAADLVLLDDSFSTILAAVESGRATFTNIRRFLTYHLTDNVAELAPFLAWGLTGGQLPLALGVLQILALDIGTDLLPALALGAEPPNPRTMDGPAQQQQLLDRRVLTRAFGVLGSAEAMAVLTAFAAVLLIGGWRWADNPEPALLAMASGTAFAAVILGQLTNAFACRSETRWIGAVIRRPNRLLPAAVGTEIVAMLAFLGIPAVASLLGGTFPDATGWLLAGMAVPAVIVFDTIHKAVRARARTRGDRPSSVESSAP